MGQCAWQLPLPHQQVQLPVWIGPAPVFAALVSRPAAMPFVTGTLTFSFPVGVLGGKDQPSFRLPPNTSLALTAEIEQKTSKAAVGLLTSLGCFQGVVTVTPTRGLLSGTS